MRRMWINQPSNLQRYHAMHGVKVIAKEPRGDMVEVYFIDGAVVSMVIHRDALSKGWKK